MTTIDTYSASFSELLPAQLEPGVLYVSMEYAVTKHLCASGCGEVVVLPLHPRQWTLIYDGEAVTVDPSIGTVGLACGSHYWIRRSHVVWARPLTAEQTHERQHRDRHDVRRYLEPGLVPEPQPVQELPSLATRLKRLLRGWR